MNDSDKTLEEEKLEILKRTIEKRPLGYTLKEVSDIPKIKETIGTRNTVRKYINILLDQGEIKSRKIGAYKLYHSKKRIIMKKLFREYPQLKKFFLNLFKSISTVLSDNIDVIGKEIGIEMFKSSEIMKSRVSNFRQDLKKELKEIPFKRFLRVIKLRFAMDFDQNVQIKEEKGGIYYFIIGESEFIKEGAEFHFYLQAGLIESMLRYIFDRKINVNVEKIDKTEQKCRIKFETEVRSKKRV
ncbi:MAG: hypothetical protein GF329_09505 [Candidatus Lokiarchaeota archaeon]|nr:hypothetical protein [Candidatus Lokiarchaeota archaeon]